MTAWRPLLLTWDAIFQPQPRGDVADNPLACVRHVQRDQAR
jgi:hypothetical protein